MSIDDELRRAGRAAYDSTRASVDVTAERAALDARGPVAAAEDEVPVRPVGAVAPRRRWWIAAAAAVVVVLVAGVAIALATRDHGAIETPTTEPAPPTAPPTAVPSTATATTGPPPPTTVAQASTISPTTNAAVPTTAAPAPTTVTTVAPAPTTTVAAGPQTLAVDAAAPPPLYVPRPVIAMPLTAEAIEHTMSVTIGEQHIAVSRASTVEMYEYGGAGGVSPVATSVNVGEPLSQIVLGPGDVVYGLSPPRLADGQAMPLGYPLIAMPSGGERTGTVVAEALLPVYAYVELPQITFGLGPDGIVDRARDVNRTVFGYVDDAGAPRAWSGPTPMLLTFAPDRTGGGRVAVVGSDLAWDLAVTKSPTHGGEYVGPSPPTPTSGGRAVYSLTIGPALVEDVDFPPNSMPVVAILEPDGSGRWIRLPDGWSVAASDVWGTVLMHIADDVLELALLDDVLAQGPAA